MVLRTTACAGSLDRQFRQPLISVVLTITAVRAARDHLQSASTCRSLRSTRRHINARNIALHATRFKRIGEVLGGIPKHVRLDCCRFYDAAVVRLGSTRHGHCLAGDPLTGVGRERAFAAIRFRFLKASTSVAPIGDAISGARPYIEEYVPHAVSACRNLRGRTEPRSSASGSKPDTDMEPFRLTKGGAVRVPRGRAGASPTPRLAAAGISRGRSGGLWVSAPNARCQSSRRVRTVPV